MDIQGALIIDKPAGLTSHDVVARVRRVVKTRRVGHAGTLDPFATGVLVVCVGYATRLTQFLVGLDKRYTATIRFGYATDTHDITGKPVTPILSSKTLKAQDITSALLEFTGPQMQIPPMYSAKKIAGERLYRAAREGRDLERPPSPVTVYAMSLIEEDGGFLANADGTLDATIAVHCSSGTYVRRLAHDIGVRLELGAHLVALRRESVGPHRIEQSVALSRLENFNEPGQVRNVLLSPADTVIHLPRLELTDEELKKVRNGREIQLDRRVMRLPEGIRVVALCNQKGDLQAIGDLAPGRTAVKPQVVLAT